MNNLINIISSTLENNDFNIPLVKLLNIIFSLNVLEIFYILLLLLIIFYKYFNIYIITFIGDLLNKLPNKFLAYYINDLLGKFNKVINSNKKFINIMFMVILLMLLCIKIINLYLSYEILINIEDSITVYKNFKFKKSVLPLLIYCKYSPINTNNILLLYKEKTTHN